MRTNQEDMAIIIRSFLPHVRHSSQLTAELIPQQRTERHTKPTPPPDATSNGP